MKLSFHGAALALLLGGQALGASAAPRPILFVPGLWYKYAPLVYQKRVFGPYRQWLVAAGYKDDDIHDLDYISIASLRTVERRLGSQMEAIRQSYPPGTQFDVITHSLGAFAALATILDTGFAAHVKKFISLSGVPQGWDGPGICKTGLCGLLHPLIIPYRSNFVVDMLDSHKDAFDHLEKCSLFSPDDELVNPYDAGAFPDGVNVRLPGLSHMDMVWTEAPFRAMRENCYRE